LIVKIEALRKLLFLKGIISKDEFITKFEKLDNEMKEKAIMVIHKKASFFIDDHRTNRRM